MGRMEKVGGMGKRKYSIDASVPTRVTALGAEELTSLLQDGQKREQWNNNLYWVKLI